MVVDENVAVSLVLVLMAVFAFRELYFLIWRCLDFKNDKNDSKDLPIFSKKMPPSYPSPELREKLAAEILRDLNKNFALSESDPEER